MTVLKIPIPVLVIARSLIAQRPALFGSPNQSSLPRLTMRHTHTHTHTHHTHTHTHVRRRASIVRRRRTACSRPALGRRPALRCAGEGAARREPRQGARLSAEALPGRPRPLEYHSSTPRLPASPPTTPLLPSTVRVRAPTNEYSQPAGPALPPAGPLPCIAAWSGCAGEGEGARERRGAVARERARVAREGVQVHARAQPRFIAWQYQREYSRYRM